MLKSLFKRKKRYNHEIAPDEIFLDSSNIPDFDRHQFEGRIEKAISSRTIFFLGIFFGIIGIFFLGRVSFLQIQQGSVYAERSENNHLTHSYIFADRGLITDRKGNLLAWNSPGENVEDYSRRVYTEVSGFNNLLGYVKYPAKDSKGILYSYEITGRDGVENYFNSLLAGNNGLNIVETDVRGKPQSSSVIHPPVQGKKLVLSTDADLQAIFFKHIKQTVDTAGFVGGAAVMMDIGTGEIISLTTYPEFNSQIMTDGKDSATINGYFKDPATPLLDRAISGLYAPGSIIKPFIALGALSEGIINADKKIESTGSISIPNPYFPDKPTVFKDWRINGWTDIKEAIAVSSDVFFYAIGGGYQDQKGLGIDLIGKYVSMFGFAAPFPQSFFSVKNNGVIPTPDWKAKMFNGDQWRIGDTYHTSIGQFGFQVTPMQAVRATAALARDGVMVEPSIIKKGEEGFVEITPKIIKGINPSTYPIAKEGMRMAVTSGTLTSLNFPQLQIAAKSGTAEVGSRKNYVNSWVVGFFPYEKPKYAFAIILEKGPAVYTEGAQAAVKRVFEEMLSASSTEAYR